MKLECKAEVMKRIVQVVRALTDEATFAFKPDGLSMKTTDTPHVAMVEVIAEKKAFAVYESTELAVPLDLKKFWEALTLADDDEVINITHDEEKKAIHLAYGAVKRRLGILSDDSDSSIKIPKLELEGRATVQMEKLQRAVKASESFAEWVKLDLTEKGLNVTGDGDDDRAEGLVELKEPKKGKDTISANYQLAYLMSFFKVIKSEDVLVEFGPDYPIRFSFDACDGVRASFLLAPRIESD